MLLPYCPTPEPPGTANKARYRFKQPFKDDLSNAPKHKTLFRTEGI
jgi:hypothetical protein